MTFCAVAGCGSESSLSTDLTFHRLPSSLIPRSRWLLALGPLPDNSYVCSRHFEANMFSKQGNTKTLKPDAVPKLALDPSPNYERCPNFNDCSGEVGLSGELMACRICLAVDRRLYSIRGRGLEDSFAALAGVALSTEERFPRQLCVFCLTKLSRCATFREKCQRSTALLQTLSDRGLLKINDIKAVDRNSHQLTDKLTRNKLFQFATGPLFTAPPLIKTEDDENSHITTGFIEVQSFESDDFMKNDENDTEISPTFEVPIEKKEISETKKVKLKAESPKYKKVKVKTEHSNAHSDIDDYKEIDARDFDSDSSDETLIKLKKGKRKRVNLKKEKTVKCPKKVKNVKNKKDDDSTLTGLDTDPSSKPVRSRKRVRNPDVDSAFDKKYNCKTTLLSKEEQKQEIEDRKKNSKSAYTCDVCGKGYKTESTLLTHKTYHDPKSLPAECDVCLLRFRSRRSLLKHQDGHRATFTCNDCGYVSRHRTHAKDHSLTHKGATYTCPYCQKVYNHQTSYYNHIRVQHPGQNEACDECGETFAAGRGIMLHKARAHKQYGKPNIVSKCAVCEVTFLTAEALQRHEELSVGVSHAALWPCVACGESCASDAARAAHAAETHPPTARHYCKECDKTFASASSFALHVDRKHRNRRAASDPSRPREPRAGLAPSDYPCVCEICGKRYSCLATLQYHMNVHLGLKPFQCPHCPKAFPHQGQHRMHMRVHTGERPYQCKQCPLAFSRRNNFAKHVRTVHLREQVKCDKCGKLMSIASITAHVRAVHMNMPYVRKRDRTKKKLALVTES